MKKITLTIWFVVLFGFYVAYERLNPSPPVVIAPTGQGSNSTPAPVAIATEPAARTSSPAPAPAPAKTPTASPKPAPTSAPAPTPTPVGMYKDGTYTGSSADAYYGNVQVQAVVQSGKLTNVTFLDYPQTHQTSVYINSQAMPYLTQEAIQAQSANVNVVSGATLTSQAFMQSLASALAQAKNS
jgi:uncharacterized protein with FMN-binding domain